jgi:hypothetical protein
MRKIIRSRDKVRLYFGTVKSATGGRHFMAWANSREHALSLVGSRAHGNRAGTRLCRRAALESACRCYEGWRLR